MKYRIGDYGNYIFDASAKTITFSDLKAGSNYNMKLSDILMITNVTDNVIIYRFEEQGKGGSLSGTNNSTLTLDYDTTSMSDTDELLIYVDTPDHSTSYDSTTEFFNEINITERGASFPVDLQSKVSTEGMTFMDGIVHTLSDTDTEDGFLQIFRASADNVNTIYFACKGEEAAFVDTLVDAFDYPNEAGFDAVWVSSNSTNWNVRRDTYPIYSGTACMRLDVNNSSALNATVTKTYSSYQDWSTNTTLSFRVYCDELTGKIQLRIRDNVGNVMTQNITFPARNVWYLNEARFEEMSGYSSMDMSNISEIEFLCQDTNSNPQYYIDDMHLNNSNYIVSIDLDIELYDFGSNSSPTTIGTPMTLDDGTTSANVQVNQQSRIHTIDLYKGVYNNNNLTIGNYYGIYIKRPTTGTVHLLGKSTEQLYSSGICGTVESSSITSLSNKSLGFTVFSEIPGIVRKIIVKPNNQSVGSYIYIMMIDKQSSKLNRILSGIEMGTETEKLIQFGQDMPDVIYVGDEYTLNMVWADSLASLANKVIVDVTYSYKSFPIYG